MPRPKLESRTFTHEEFAQFISEKVDRAEGRIKGFHLVLNAIANELRNSDPQVAGRISANIELALEPSASEATKDIVAMYVGILSHGSIPPREDQQ